jgi:hypothetical protein
MAAVPPGLDPTLTFYEIKEVGNIIWMMTTMTNGAAPNLTSDYRLIVDIDMSPVGAGTLVSIASSNTVAAEGPFVGQFSGLKSPPPTDPHESLNYKITIPLSKLNGSSYFGLFGYLGTGAKIISVDIEYTGDTYTYTNPSVVVADSYFGSLVGFSTGATVELCNIIYTTTNNLTITHNTTNDVSLCYTGGICGRIQSNSTLKGSKITFNGPVQFYCNTIHNTNLARNFGGICGYLGQFSSSNNTFTGNTLELSSNTTFGSSVNNGIIGGFIGSAVGGLIINNCIIKQKNTLSSSGTLKLQVSDNDATLAQTSAINNYVGGFIGSYDLRAQQSCSIMKMTLPNYTLSLYTESNNETLYIGGMYGYLETVSAIITGTSLILTLDDHSINVNNFMIQGKTRGTSSGSYNMGGMFGQINAPHNITNCNLDCTNTYNALLEVGLGVGNANAPICRYGSIAGASTIGGPGNIVRPDYNSESYRIISNCNVIVGGITNILIDENSASSTIAAQESFIGGLIGQVANGRRSPNNNPAIGVIIDECKGTFSNDVSIRYSHTNPSLTLTAANSLYLGGLIGRTLGSIVRNCEVVFGNDNNTVTISTISGAHSNLYQGLGIGIVDPSIVATNVTQIGSTISNCIYKINGNVNMTNSSTRASGQTYTGGLAGRINILSSYSSSYQPGQVPEVPSLDISGNLTIVSLSNTGRCRIGGLAGELSGDVTNTAVLTNSNASIGNNFIVNGNIGQNFDTLIGGMVGIVVNTVNFTNCQLTCNGSTTLTSTAAGTGFRYIGGMIGWSGEGTVNNTVKNVTSNTVTYNGPFLITVASIANDFGGGLFGRIQDGTLVSDCYGEFNSTLTINNQGITSGSKAVGGICGSLAIAKAAAPFLVDGIRISRILVQKAATFSIVTNESGGNSRCSAMFGIVQDTTLSPGGDSAAASCTATFNGIVSVTINNTSSGAVYLGGIVAENIRSGIESNILNLTNGIIIDNQSTTNSNCFAGIICGRTTSNLLGNPATTNNNTVNISGTAIIDTNTNSNTAAAGTLAGQVDSDFKDNTVSGQTATFIINATSEIDGTWAGGLIAQITNTQPTQLVTVSGNSLFAGHLTITTNSVSTGSSFNGGLVGRINTTNITFSNNVVSVNGSATLRNIAVNSTVYMALLFAGLGQSGVGGPYTLINNTFIAYQGIQISTSNSIPTIYIDDNLAKSDEATASQLVNCNAYVCGTGQNALLNFTAYPITDALGLTIYGQNYPITSSYTSITNLYRIDVLPAILINIGCIPGEPVEVITCCTANICNKNPQVASYSNQTIINRRAGQAMIANVDNKTIAQNNNTGRIYVQPMFSSYQQYMTYLQSKNAR